MSSFLLKMFAIITMSIDHIGLALFNNNLIYRSIGRIAMPIFAFQVGIGFSKTHSKPKYILRMFITALISQLPFFLMLYASGVLNYSLNICFTFTIALTTLYFIDLGKNNKLFYLVSLFPLLLSLVIPMDYGIYAVLLVLLFYLSKNNKFIITIGMIAITVFYCFTKNTTIQAYMLFALPFLYFYNGTKGKNIKYWFYAFYPLHMLIIALIKIYISAIKI